jgi:glycosyltransferase involved in cell wall biosynthesis
MIVPSPLISVLMPVYNAERYVAEAVESILAQSFRDFEFIIIDDGSTDGSLAILEKYAARDERIRLISRPNTGLVGALNEGLSMARADLIARMDADDIAMPERFASQAEYLSNHHEVVAVGGRILAIGPFGDDLTEMLDHESHEVIDREHLRANCSIAHPAAMIRASSLLAIGGYRAKYWPAEDLDLWLRMAEVGHLANLSEVVLKYRQNPQSIGHTQWFQQRERSQAAVADACVRRGLSYEEDNRLVQGEPPSQIDLHRKWAWWALTSGHIGTARRHAFSAFRRAPFAVQSWRVVYCALRGR